jgi:hypothetical protein
VERVVGMRLPYQARVVLGSDLFADPKKPGGGCVSVHFVAGLKLPDQARGCYEVAGSKKQGRVVCVDFVAGLRLPDQWGLLWGRRSEQAGRGEWCLCGFNSRLGVA